MSTDQTPDLKIDFVSGASKHRRQFGGGRKQPLARAIGLNGEPPTVIDATTGTGRDGWVLASLGCPITWLERNAIVHRQLAAALTAAMQHPDTAEIAARVTLVHRDASEHILTLEPHDRPDVI